jgi:hypothetical protein
VGDRPGLRTQRRRAHRLTSPAGGSGMGPPVRFQAEAGWRLRALSLGGFITHQVPAGW